MCMCNRRSHYRCRGRGGVPPLLPPRNISSILLLCTTTERESERASTVVVHHVADDGVLAVGANALREAGHEHGPVTRNPCFLQHRDGGGTRMRTATARTPLVNLPGRLQRDKLRSTRRRLRLGSPASSRSSLSGTPQPRSFPSVSSAAKFSPSGPRRESKPH